MTNHDLVSVIIPVYNVEKYLSRCVESIRKQTYSHLEILLIDDGSTDSSGVLCDEMAKEDTRIHVIHQVNSGLSGARNTGIAHAKGKYLTFVDSDDWAALDMIEYLHSLIQKFHCKMSVCQNTIIKNGHEYCQISRGEDCVLSAHDSIEDILYDKGVAGVSACGKLYKASLFDTVKWPEGKLFEDRGFMHLLYKKSGTVACGMQSKYYYFIRENSITTSKFSEKQLDLLEMTDAMVHDVVSWYPDLQRGALRQRMWARFSTLNRIILSSEANRWVAEKKEIIDFIKRHAFEVLLDPKAPRRDRLAIISLLISDRLYAFLWRTYKRKRG